MSTQGSQVNEKISALLLPANLFVPLKGIACYKIKMLDLVEPIPQWRGFSQIPRLAAPFTIAPVLKNALFKSRQRLSPIPVCFVHYICICLHRSTFTLERKSTCSSAR